jgi:APA family basic amino acid/polyamine antiporter
MSEIQGTLPASEAGDTSLFVRRATGLVRQVSPASGVILNIIPGSPVQVLAAGLFFALGLFPGGDFFLGLALTLPMTLSFAYAFGLLTAAIPRSGGDYMFVSRVIHPAVGLVSSFCMTLAGILSNAFFGIVIASIAVGPGLVVLGVVSKHPTLVHWGGTVSSSHGWQFGLGCVLMVLAALILAGGWSWTLPVMKGLFTLTLIGLGISVLIALFTSNHSFASHFNSFAQPFTHKPDTYHDVIATAQKAGVNPHPAFSFGNTIPLLGVLAGFSIYSWFSTAQLGGEIRQARSLRTANVMALSGILSIGSVALCVLIFFHSYGKAFLTAAYSGGMPAQIPAPPFYFFLTSAQVNNIVLAVFLVICFTLFWPLITAMSYLQPTRMIFAYAFDGILPKGVTRLRRGAPIVAVAITTLLSIAALAWAVFVANNFFQVLVYAVLAQLVAMMFVGLAAVLFPYLKPDLYRASASTRQLLGIPLVSIAGALSIVSGLLLYVLYFHYPALGLADKGKLFTWLGGAVGAALVYYVGVRIVRSRQGVDLARTYAEIPPE